MGYDIQHQNRFSMVFSVELWNIAYSIEIFILYLIWKHIKTKYLWSTDTITNRYWTSQRLTLQVSAIEVPILASSLSLPAFVSPFIH